MYDATMTMIFPKAALLTVLKNIALFVLMPETYHPILMFQSLEASEVTKEQEGPVKGTESNANALLTVLGHDVYVVGSDSVQGTTDGFLNDFEITVTPDDLDELIEFVRKIKDLKANPGFCSIDVGIQVIKFSDAATGNVLELNFQIPSNPLPMLKQLLRHDLELMGNDQSIGISPDRLVKFGRVKTFKDGFPYAMRFVKNPNRDGHIVQLKLGPTFFAVIATVHMDVARESITDTYGEQIAERSLWL